MQAEGVDVRLTIPAETASPTPTSAPSGPTVGQPRPPDGSTSPLPRTGTEVAAVVLVAVVLLALGVALVAAARRRSAAPRP